MWVRCGGNDDRSSAEGAMRAKGSQEGVYDLAADSRQPRGGAAPLTRPVGERGEGLAH